MILIPLSFNGTILNKNSSSDYSASTDYDAYFPRADAMLQLTSDVGYVKRAGAVPVMAGKDFQPVTINLNVSLLHDTTTLEASINTLFDVLDETPHQLIVMDQDNSNKQYYVYATPKSVQTEASGGPEVVITLAIDDPIWQSVTQNTQTWNITASGQSTDFTAGGNAESYPIFEITPTVSPPDGYLFNQFVQMIPNSAFTWKARPLEVTGGGFDTAAKISDTDNFFQLNGAIDSSTDIIAYDTVTGSIPIVGMGMVGTEQISWANKTGTSSGNLTGVVRGIGGTTAAGHADNAVISVSRMQANGNDLRVYVDGAEVNRWLNSINTTATKIWIAIDIPIYQRPLLNTAIGIGDTVTEIVFQWIPASIDSWFAMPNSGRVLIDSEEFTYTSKSYDPAKPQISIVINARAVRNTSAANHAAGATIYWLPYDINIVYGNTQSTAQNTDDTTKPVISLASTNSSFVYTEFSDTAALRSGRWQRAVLGVANSKFTQSHLYTGVNNSGEVDPANVAGMALLAYQLSGVWKPETGSMMWWRGFTDGVSGVSESGEKMQKASGSWPALAALMGSKDGLNWTIIQNEPAVAASSDYSSFVSWAYASTDLTIPAGTIALAYWFSGTILATANNEADYGATAITVGLTNYPTVTRRAQQSNYQFNGLLKNTGTGESININCALQLVTDTLIIDTDPDFPTAKFKGLIVNSAVSISSIRARWLKCPPGLNTITFTGSSVGSVTIVIKWRDRVAFL
jgi:phage-related protein